MIIRRPRGVVRKCRDGRDTVQGHIRHVSDAQGHHPDALIAPTWPWLLACRRLRYVTGSPSGSVDTTRMDLLESRVLGLHYYRFRWALRRLSTRHLYGSTFLLRAWLGSSRRDSDLDEEKEGSLWLIRLREQRTRIGWRQ